MADLLRFATAGSVDDGKSTLIGRLLYDTKSVFEDQLDGRRADQRRPRRRLHQPGAAHRRPAGRARAGHHHRRRLPLLRHARAVVHPRGHPRPRAVHPQHGHRRVDRRPRAGAGRRPQGRRRADPPARVAVAALLRVPHLVLCGQQDGPGRLRPGGLRRDRRRLPRLRRGRSTCPTSRRSRSPRCRATTSCTAPTRCPGTTGRRCSSTSSRCTCRGRTPSSDRRGFPVQYVIRPMSTERPDYRGYAGTLSSGTLQVGDEVVVLPSGRRTTVEAIDVFEDSLPQAVTGQAVTVRLADELDVSRGDMIVAADAAPTVTRVRRDGVLDVGPRAAARPARPGQAHDPHREGAGADAARPARRHLSPPGRRRPRLRLNDIGRVTLRTASPLFVDDYADDRTTGAFVLVDEVTGATLGAGMVGSTIGVRV